MAPRRSKVQPTGQPAPVQPATVQRAPAQRVPAQRAPVQPALEEENIDLDVSETSEEEVMAPAVSALDDLTTHVAPIIKPVVKSNRALDIDLLFERGKGKPSVCKYCK